MENRYDYEMDEFGNLENRTGTNNDNVVFDVRDLTADPSTNRLEGKVYDNLGNLKQVANEDGIHMTLFFMDQGHVAKVLDSDSGNVLYRYYYDAGGQRRIKARGDSADGIWDDASYSFYEGNDLICQLDRGEEIQDDRAYQPKFLLLDHLGTTRAELKFVEDEDTGDITPTIATGYDYMPYGELITEDHLIESLPGNPDPRTEQVLFTGKPRDAESGLDNFGSRSYTFNQGRFTSVDPLFFQAKMIIDPQNFNLYAYTSNNPVMYIDPDGEAIRLADDEDERRKQMDALKDAVGSDAAGYLYVNEEKKTDENGNVTTEYYVGIYTNGPTGEGESFEDKNDVTETFEKIINHDRVVNLHTVPEGTRVEKGVVAPINERDLAFSPGIQQVKPDNSIHVYLLDPSVHPGYIPSDLMFGGQPGYVGQGELVAHELGHAWASIKGQNTIISNRIAIRLENAARRLKVPNYPKRKRHNK